MGLEGDMTASSRCMTFMERSSYSEAIEQNENFVTGIFAINDFFDQRMTVSGAAFRPDINSVTGLFFGDGQWGIQGRLTGLPLYEDEGRHLLHLGVSGGWRSGQNFKDTVELRARPEMRDDDPSGGTTGVTGGDVPGADNNRLIDTGLLTSNSQFLTGLESLYILGPFSAQAEYGWIWVDNVVLPTGARNNYVFNGGYVQLAYTLTGENRAYDRRMGTLAREYFGKRGPFYNAFIVRDADGNICSSWGAWEVAMRYSYVDLNDGVGAERIQGGEMQGLTLALNWYLNTNLNVMIDWAHNRRYDLPVAVTPGASSTIPGVTNGFGARVQFQF